MPLKCPRDRTLLVTATSDGSRVERCPRCSGVAVSVALLRRIAPRERLRALWLSLSVGTPGDACPSCAKPLLVVPVQCGARAIDLDACRNCQLLWFDADELTAFSPADGRPRPSASKDGLSQEAREALAISRLDASRHAANEPSWTDGVVVDVAVNLLLSLLP